MAKKTKLQMVLNLLNWNNQIGSLVWAVIVFTIFFYLFIWLNIPRPFALIPMVIFIVWRLIVIKNDRDKL